MRIAQVAPLLESVPPHLYGGTERVVSYLTDELVRQGHDVTLFASGDSVTDAQLIPCSARSLRLDPDVDRQTVFVNGVAVDLPLGRLAVGNGWEQTAFDVLGQTDGWLH